MIKIEVEPDVRAAYETAPLEVAQWADRIMDTLQAGDVPPHEEGFTGGRRSVVRRGRTEDHLIIYKKMQPDLTVVLYLGPDLLGR